MVLKIDDPTIARVAFTSSENIELTTLSEGQTNVRINDDADTVLIGLALIDVRAPVSVVATLTWDVVLRGHSATLDLSTLDANGDALFAANVREVTSDGGVTAVAAGTHYVRVHADTDGGATETVGAVSARFPITTIADTDITAVQVSVVAPISSGALADLKVLTLAGSRIVAGDACAWASVPGGLHVAASADGPVIDDAMEPPQTPPPSEAVTGPIGTYTLTCTIAGQTMAQVQISSP
jgi:hypothetical protein